MYNPRTPGLCSTKTFRLFFNPTYKTSKTKYNFIKSKILYTSTTILKQSKQNSGITPSLSNSAKKLTEVAINEATKRKIMISCDLNYRSNLWTPEEAQKTMIPLMDKVDILIGGKKDPEIMLGEKTKDENQTSYEEMIESMARKYDFKHVGLSLRESFSADHNDWAGIFYSKGN